MKPGSAIDPRRAARAFALAVWAGFFVWLWASGEVSRYLGPRTYWVVPFGAVTLATAVVAQVGTLRRESPRALHAREAIGLALLVAPVLAVVIVPRPALGALAASKKATGAIALGSLAAPAPEPGKAISFIDIHYASRSREYAAALGIGDGTDVRLLGFVTTPEGAPPGTFELTRFYVSCCAADAVPYSVTVGSNEAPAVDSWLEVSGTLSLVDGRYVVVADDVTERSEPEDPYLY